MQQSSPSPVNLVDLYRPACPKCGLRMMIARIEPSGKPNHDMRTFECGQCGHTRSEVVRYK
jgi:ribosomal protein S27AE